jgi:cytochrome c551
MASMTTNRARLVSVLLLLVASLLLAAGCGGDDSSSDSSSSSSDTDTSTTEGTSDAVDAKATFATTCGGCHMLSDAGTTGAVGPDLDKTTLDAAGISALIASGRGAMPPNLLEGAEADAVSEYVAAQAAK